MNFFFAHIKRACIYRLFGEKTRHTGRHHFVGNEVNGSPAPSDFLCVRARARVKNRREILNARAGAYLWKRDRISGPAAATDCFIGFRNEIDVEIM